MKYVVHSHHKWGDFPSLNRDSDRKTPVFEAGNTLEKVKLYILIRTGVILLLQFAVATRVHV